MATIDNRVIKMEFNNSLFEKKVATSVSSLASLKEGLNFDQANANLENFQTTANGINTNNLSTSIAALGGKFDAMSIAAIAAISNITTALMRLGTQMVNSLYIQPRTAGFREYELQINSIQTILANTQKEGATLTDVSAALDELNEYADKTIYNFAEMTKNIGLFTVAGVKLDSSVNAIKGFSNVAAMSGVSAQKAAGATYQLSQAMAAGTVRLQDWISMEQAGIGSTIFQEQLMNTARIYGVAIDDMLAKHGTFRYTLQENWLTADIMAQTLAQFTGDLTDEQLKALGYTDEQVAEIQKLAQTAVDAATKVRTLTQMFSVMGEVLSSGWAVTWKYLIGDFNEATSLLTDINNIIGELLAQSSDRRNNLLEQWYVEGGQVAMAEALKNAIVAIGSVIYPISEAFASVFNAPNGKVLAEITQEINKFIYSIILNEEQVKNLFRTFRGLFSLFGLGIEVLKFLAGALFELVHGVLIIDMNILNLTGDVGDLITVILKMVRETSVLDEIFKLFAGTVGGILGALMSLFTTIFNVGARLLGFSEYAVETGENVSGFASVLKVVNIILGGMMAALNAVEPVLTSVRNSIVNIIQSAEDSIVKFLGNIDNEQIMDGIFASLLGGMVIIYHKMMTAIKSFLGTSETLIKSASSVLDSVRKSLELWQSNIKSTVIKNIATALLITAAALVALSYVPFPSLLSGMATFAGVLLLLTTTLKAVTLMDLKDLDKISKIIPTLIAISISIALLSVAVSALSKIEGNLMEATLAVMGMLLVTAAAAKIISSKEGEFIKGALSIIAMGASTVLMAMALERISNIDPESLSRSAVILGGLLMIIAAILVAGKSIKGVGPTLTSISLGVLSMMGSVYLLSLVLEKLDFESLILSSRLLAVFALSLLLFLNLLPKNLTANTMLIQLGLSIIAFAGALHIVSQIPSDKLLESAKVIASLLAVFAIAGGLLGMVGGGSAAIIALAASLWIIIPPLVLLGTIPLGLILSGVLGFAVALGLLVGLSALVAVMAPALVSLAGSIAMLGAGAILVAGAVGILALGLTGLTAVAGSLVPALLIVLTGLVAALPTIVDAFVKMGAALLQVLQGLGPALLRTVLMLIDVLLQGLAERSERISNSIATIILNIFKGVVGAIIGEENMKAMENGLKYFFDGLFGGIITGMFNFAGNLINGIVQLGKWMWEAFLDFWGIHSDSDLAIEEFGPNLVGGMVTGMENSLSELLAGTDTLGQGVFDRMKEWADKIATVSLLPSESQEVNDRLVSESLQQRMAAKEAAAAAELAEEKKENFKEEETANNSLTQNYASNATSVVDIEQEKYDALRKEVENNTKYQEWGYNEQIAAWTELQKEFDSQSKYYQEAEEKLLDLRYNQTKEYKDKIESLSEEIKNSYDLFEAPETDIEETSQFQLIDNLRRQNESIKSFYDNMEKLIERGADQALVEEIRDKGVTAASELEALLSMDSHYFDQYNKSFKERQQLADDIAKSVVDSEMGDLGSSAGAAATNTALALSEGLANALPVMKEEVTDVTDNMINELNTRADDYEVVGVSIGNAIINGIQSMQEAITSSITSIMVSAINVARAQALALSAPSIAFQGVSGAITKSSNMASSSVGSSSNGSSSQTSPNREGTAVVNNYNFQQTNNSPKSLSNSEIYRATRNQFSEFERSTSNA